MLKSVLLFGSLSLAALVIIAAGGSSDIPGEHAFQVSCMKHIRSAEKANAPAWLARIKGRGHSEPGVDWYIVPRTLSSDIPISKGLEAARMQMLAQERFMAMQKTQFQNLWSCVGPFNTAGRSRVVVFDPVNPDIMYTGAASGGVWKTTDGGETWIPKTDHFTTLAVGHIAIDKNNHNIVFAGTGEGSDNWDRVYGDGLYKSTDAGETWTNIMTSRDVGSDECINKIALHPESSDTIFCALRGSQSSGLYKTTNGGAKWTLALSGVARDVMIDPHQPNRVYAAIGKNYGEGGNGIYVSDRNGAAGTFKRADSLLPPGDSIGNLAIDISPSKPGYIVALISKSYNVNRTSDGYLDSRDFLGLYISTDYGESWYRTPASDDPPLSRFLRSQGDYNLYVRFHPTDHRTIFIGGIHNWRSTDLGVSFSQVTDYDTWVDMHYGDFSPTDPNVMAVASDGGVYLTRNCTTTPIVWEEKGNRLATMQFYGMDFDKINTRRVAGGTQDRRNNLYNGGATDWVRLTYGGDGGYVAFDKDDPNTFYIASQYGNIARTKDGGSNFEWFGHGLGSTDRYNFGFVTPFIMHPTNSKVLFLGGQKMYRLNGDAWEEISESLTRDSSSFSAFQDLAICKNNPNVLWGVTGSNKRVFRTTNSMDERDSVKWEMVNGVSSRVPGLFLASIAVHPDSGDVAYVGTSEFTSRAGIYKTTDGGKSWIRMKGTTPEPTLPSMPIGAIAIYEPDPEIVFAGTDLGVYISRNGGRDWQPFNNGLPRVVVDDLKITDDGILYAATHGRGMWMTDISLVAISKTDAAASGIALEQNYPNPFNPSTSISYTLPVRGNVALQVFNIEGKLVATIVDAVQEAGTHRAVFNAGRLPGGTYFYRLTTPSGSRTRKMILMK